MSQKKLEGQSDFRFKQPSAPRHKHGTAEAVLLSKGRQKEKIPSEKFGASKAAQASVRGDVSCMVHLLSHAAKTATHSALAAVAKHHKAKACQKASA